MLPVCARVAVVLTLAALSHNEAVGQVCFRGKQLPACGGYPILEFSGAGLLTEELSGGGRFALLGTAGYARNVTSNWALGVALKGAADDDGWRAGPAVRIRRWIASRVSIDVTAGVFTSDVWPKSRCIRGRRHLALLRCSSSP
jgi:hypothetical protein